MMTTSRIAQQMGKTSFQIRHLVHEFLGSFFSFNPLPSLYVREKEHDQIVKQFLDGVEFHDPQGQEEIDARKRFPETD